MEPMSRYCPVLDRIVKVKSEMEEEKRKPVSHVAICQKEKKVCNGDCNGCFMM